MTTYEARKARAKEAEMETHNLIQEAARAMPERIAAAADVAWRLMQDDAATFKAGYSFANAVYAAAEADKLTVNGLWVAMVAERLHLRLVAG